MEDLMGNLVTLGLLVLLQAVLGFDNLLYISLESKRVPEDKQNYVRKLGIGMAIVLRIVLLFVLVSVIEYFKDPFYIIPENGFIEGSFSVHSLIVLLGGAFIIYTATKEVVHMMTLEDVMSGKTEKASVNSVISMIVVMNLVFSFDSILSAIALTDVFWVMATAIVISGILMIYLAEKVSNFLKKNRMYEVLGLFVLFVVGIMLLTEGGHLAHLSIFGEKIVAMSKTTFYFVIVVLILTDLVQSRYQKKINLENEKKNQA
ncbi:MAG: TerC family protein [Saprospiraceae bacterium]